MDAYNHFEYGDECFMFLDFNIDSSIFSILRKQPLKIAPGIYLASTPQHVLGLPAGKYEDSKVNVGLAEWFYPGFTFGSGIVNVCIKMDKTIPVEIRKRYFWLMIGALYLAKPLHMKIAGGFSYGNEEEGFLGKSPCKIPNQSNISLEMCFPSNDKCSLCYTEDDFKQAGIYFSRLIEINESRQTAPRPFFIIKAFLEAIFFERLVYASTIFSKLFPLIDSFSGNTLYKHEQYVSNRLSIFLNKIPSVFLERALTQEEIRMRIASIWRYHRGPDLHGYLKEIEFSKIGKSDQVVSQSELKDLFDLMEFSRLLIIKMIMLDEITFQDYCKIPLPLQRYSSSDEKMKSDQDREIKVKEFFDKSFLNTLSSMAYSDFKDTYMAENLEKNEELAVNN